jgi:hypothetical protein
MQNHEGMSRDETVQHGWKGAQEALGVMVLIQLLRKAQKCLLASCLEVGMSGNGYTVIAPPAHSVIKK